MKLKKLLVCITSLTIVFGSFFSPSMVYGEVFPGDAGDSGGAVASGNVILSFNALPADIGIQHLQVGDSIDDVVLPTQLIGSTETGAQATIHPVTWRCDTPFTGMDVGSYTFTAALPGSHAYDPGITIPTITVRVGQAVTNMNGLSDTITQTAGTMLMDQILVRPALGRTLHLQKWNIFTNVWETKATYVLSNTLEAELNVTYPALWYSLNEVTTTWRIYIPETDTGSAHVGASVTVSALRAYQNPLAYYQLLPSVALRSNAGYTLRYGSMGLKVAMVQRRLGMGYQWEIIGPTTSLKIKAFQKSLGLLQTGTVDYGLWKRMGFDDYSWYYKAAYVSPMRTNLGSTRSQLIEAFIANAYRYIGTEYVVGAAGAPKTGIDCSGLVMQSMYATGVDPYPISVIRHSQPGYEYESRNFWASTKLRTIPIMYRARGDLIFYQNRYGTVIHVAIYLGNNKVIEAVPGGVRVADLITIYPSIKGVKRVFN